MCAHVCTQYSPGAPQAVLSGRGLFVGSDHMAEMYLETFAPVLAAEAELLKARHGQVCVLVYF